VKRLLAILISLGATSLFGDGRDSGWSFSLSCPSSGTSGVGSFLASRSGFTTSGNQHCQRYSTRFTKLSFDGYTGTAPHEAWDVGGGVYNVFALHTGDLLITPPILSTESQPIFSVDTYCPLSNVTVNWLFVQWDAAESLTLEDTYVLGYSDITATTGASTMRGLYDVDGTVVFSGSYALASNACSDGLMTGTGSGEEAATTYYTAEGSGVYKAATGRATFFFPQQNITLNSLGSLTFQGMQFDSKSSNGIGDIEHVRVTSNAAGDTFTIKPYDPAAGSIGTDFTDTITITSANSPQDGMMLGTVTRTGTGAGGPTKIACIANIKEEKGNRVICSGQSPSDSSTPYNVTFIETETSLHPCPTNYIWVNPNFDVGVYFGFCVAKYEMKNSGGNAVSTKDGAPWTSIPRDGASGAVAKCGDIGAGYYLITNAQWQAVAREIEVAQSSPGAYMNWRLGSLSNNINKGYAYTDDDLAVPIAAGEDNDGCYPNGGSCADNTAASFFDKRTHALHNNLLVWDLSGNANEWVADTIGTTQGTSGNHISTRTWDGAQDARETAEARKKWGPSGTYTAFSANPYGGLGIMSLNGTGAVTRGGGFQTMPFPTGIFTSTIGTYAPTDTTNRLGFRCTYNPVVFY
jgi:formylglycine-generating enzyme required for sulfatase activity